MEKIINIKNFRSFAYCNHEICKQLHSDIFVNKMLPEHTVSYYPVPGRGHCDLSEEAWVLWRSCIIRSIDPAFTD